METTFDYLRQFGPLLAERILETYPPLQSTKDPVAPSRRAAAQTAARSGRGHHRHSEVSAQGQGRTHRRRMWRWQDCYVLGDDPCAIRREAKHDAGDVPLAYHAQVGARGLVDHPLRPDFPHRRHAQWRRSREAARGPRGQAQQGQDRLRRQASQLWPRCGGWAARSGGSGSRGRPSSLPARTKASSATSGTMSISKRSPGRTWAAIVNPDSGVPILDSERQKLTALDFDDKLKVAETLTTPADGTTRFSALWQADRNRIQRMAPIEYIGRYMAAGSTSPLPTNCTSWPATRLRATASASWDARRSALIALTGTLMGGYADDLFNIFYRMEPRAMVREGFAYGGQGRRDFQEQYGVLETIEKIEDADNACSRATKKTVRVLRKPGASPLLFGKFLMNTTAFLALEDISDNLPRYDESVVLGRHGRSSPACLRTAGRGHPLRDEGTSRQQEPDEHPAQHAPALSRPSLRLRRDLGAGLRSADQGVCEVPGDGAGEPHAGGALCEGARPDRRCQGGTAPRQALPDLCDLHRARRTSRSGWRRCCGRKAFASPCCAPRCRPTSGRTGTSGS